MRSSGILMHITSLPGPYGVGTMGKQAYAFIDFLKKAGQSYWQILPLTPTGYGDSPYQSCSTFAGNHYLIDLDMLVEEGLLEEKEIEIPVFGMVKDEYHKTRALCTDTEEISIAREQAVYTLLYRLQEEVHRFTVGKMENAKRKTLRTSVLTRIHGIGDAKAKKLLAAFGGMGALRKATVEQIAAVPGISQKDAEAVWKDLHR